MIQQTIKAILFDMDGVIFDSEKLYYDACLVALSQNDLSLTEERLETFTGKTSEACKLMLQHYIGDMTLASKVWEDWQVAYRQLANKNGIPLKANILDTLEYLVGNNMPIVLVTSAQKTSVQENFSHVDIDLLSLFQFVVDVDMVARPKPDPEAYWLACEKLGIDVGEAIVIEDSMTGATAALSAGIKTIMINRADYAASLADKLLFQAETHVEILGFLKQELMLKSC